MVLIRQSVFLLTKNILFWLTFPCEKRNGDIRKSKIKESIEYGTEHRTKKILRTKVY